MSLLSMAPRRVYDIYEEGQKLSSSSDQSDVPLFSERGLSLGCPLIDDITGGIKTQGITEIAGEAGCGKTQCCLVLSLHNHLSINQGGLGGACAYLCCGEGEFPIRRLSQLSLAYSKKYNISSSEFLSNVHIEQCANTDNIFDTIITKLPEMCQQLNVTLIIIDSLAGAIRNEYDVKSSKEMKERTSKLFDFSSRLKRLADSYRIAIVVVNQVTSGGFSDKQESLNLLKNTDSNFFSHNSTIPALGLAWSHCINTRIMLRKDDNAIRSILTMSDVDKENIRRQIAIYNDTDASTTNDNDDDDEEKKIDNEITPNNNMMMNMKQNNQNIDNTTNTNDNTNDTDNNDNNTNTNDTNTNNDTNKMNPMDVHDSVVFSTKSVRYFTLEFSPTRPSKTIQYEITSDGIRGVHTLQEFGAKF